jgi:hypothetical protein
VTGNDGLDYAVMSAALAQDLCVCFAVGSISYLSAERVFDSHRLDCPVRRWLSAHPERFPLRR